MSPSDQRPIRPKTQCRLYPRSKTEVRRSNAEDRRPKAEDRRPMTEYRRPKTEDLRPQTEYGFRSSTLKNDRILLESSAVRQVPHATAPFMRYVYIAAYTHFELFISTAFVAFDPRPSETIEIRGSFSSVLLILFFYVLSEAIQIHTTCDASPI